MDITECDPHGNGCRLASNFHFTDEDTEAQGDAVIPSRSNRMMT